MWPGFLYHLCARLYKEKGKPIEMTTFVTEESALTITKATIDDCGSIARILVNSWQSAYRGNAG